MRRLVKANADKLHRCQECHRITDKARDGRGVQWWKFYTCAVCDVWWTPLLQDMTVIERIKWKWKLRQMKRDNE